MSRILTISFLVLSLMISALLLAGDPTLPTDCPITVVRVQSVDPVVIADIAQWTEPWEIRTKEGYFIVGVNADEFMRLEGLGVSIEIDAKLTADYCAPRFRLPDQRSGIPGYPCYRTVDETFA
ncbi:MAG: hypothetical protein DRJ61_13870, partial [Acidobacteria bacterium]